MRQEIMTIFLLQYNTSMMYEHYFEDLFDLKNNQLLWWNRNRYSE